MSSLFSHVEAESLGVFFSLSFARSFIARKRLYSIIQHVLRSVFAVRFSYIKSQNLRQTTGFSSMWRSSKLRFRGRSPTTKRSLANANEGLGLQEEPQEPGLIQLSGNESTAHEDFPGTQKVDIVAIHGLNGSPFGTWTHENKTFWLRDLLAKDIRGARIFTYKYPSHVLFSKSKATTAEFAKSLLIDLNNNRSGPGQSRRPIIFMAHGLGGIICKQALILAKQDPKFALLLERTNGVIFFGTPHRGARTLANLAVLFLDIVQAVLSISGTRLLFGGTRSDLIRNLRANSPDLRRIIESFSHLLKKIHIVSVYETEEQVPFGRLVRYHLIILLGSLCLEKIPQRSTLMMITDRGTRFCNPRSPG